jgi:hypothetical protein
LASRCLFLFLEAFGFVLLFTGPGDIGVLGRLVAPRTYAAAVTGVALTGWTAPAFSPAGAGRVRGFSRKPRTPNPGVRATRKSLEPKTRASLSSPPWRAWRQVP